MTFLRDGCRCLMSISHVIIHSSSRPLERGKTPPSTCVIKHRIMYSPFSFSHGSAINIIIIITIILIISIIIVLITAITHFFCHRYDIVHRIFCWVSRWCYYVIFLYIIKEVNSCSDKNVYHKGITLDVLVLLTKTVNHRLWYGIILLLLLLYVIKKSW